MARRNEDDDATTIPAGDDQEIGDLLRAMIEGEEVSNEVECND